MSRRRTRDVCVVGSSTFPLDVEVGAAIVDLMKEYGDGVTFHTRGKPAFDRFIVSAAEALGRPCILYPSRGGGDNWERDIRLVDAVDEVVAFFSPDHLDADEGTGTMHVVERALDKHKKVRAYSVWESKLVYAGAS